MTTSNNRCTRIRTRNLSNEANYSQSIDMNSKRKSENDDEKTASKRRKIDEGQFVQIETTKKVIKKNFISSLRQLFLKASVFRWFSGC